MSIIEVKEPYCESIFGYIYAESLYGELIPFIVKRIYSISQPDMEGNICRKGFIEFLRPSRTTFKVNFEGETLPVPKTYSELRSSSFFQYHKKEATYPFLKFYLEMGAYHPRFSYRPLGYYTFKSIYDGLTIKEAINYLKSIKTIMCEKCYYRGPGKDDRIVTYQKIFFKNIPNNFFFIDLLQFFNIYWFDENNDPKGLAEDMGDGFYRFVDSCFGYVGSTIQWYETPDNKKLKDIIEWFENIETNKPFSYL